VRYFQVDSTLGIHPTKLVVFGPLHQQNLARLNLGSFMLSLNHACSDSLGLAHDQNQGASGYSRPKSWCLRLLTLDPLSVPCPDSSPDSGPPTPCSIYPNISNFKLMYTMILFREVWLQHSPISLLPSLTVCTVMCFGSCCVASFDRYKLQER
jgi:hypothetical protein